MKNSIDILFYSVFVRVGKQYGGEEYPLGPSILATLLLSVMSISMIMSFMFVLKYWLGVIRFSVFPAWLFYVIVAAIMLLNYLMFIHKKQYLTIIEKYKDKDNKTRRKETLPYAAFFFLGLFSLPIVGFIYLLFL